MGGVEAPGALPGCRDKGRRWVVRASEAVTGGSRPWGCGGSTATSRLRSWAGQGLGGHPNPSPPTSCQGLPLAESCWKLGPQEQWRPGDRAGRRKVEQRGERQGGGQETHARPMGWEPSPPGTSSAADGLSSGQQRPDRPSPPCPPLRSLRAPSLPPTPTQAAASPNNAGQRSPSPTAGASSSDT